MSVEGTGELSLSTPIGKIKATWSQSITKPLRLNLAFAVTVDGDTLTGTSKVGRLAASKVSGLRRA